ncbi:uncharacterized protein EV154DRAFT_526931 [Mucor mucedo]|uniref:uncharacterized protein n=1 Tax=Mucor mucedo TaxID=29922 RepID=UPI0022212A09|nr:uncharacterized protein EV154DRAFT_526931 [Mucor mucedo]KAI7874779.1 hypothetical protein EV154DRAFT_526931 [Mucor mucedo]
MTSDAKIASNNTPIVTLPLDRIFSYLERPDLLKTTLVSKDWHIASSKKLWSKFKFVREKEFERIFHILSKNKSYGHYISHLELIHSDKDFYLNASHIFLITLLCPNLLSISITFHHTRSVAPPANINRRLPPPLLPRQQQHIQQQHPHPQRPVSAAHPPLHLQQVHQLQKQPFLPQPPQQQQQQQLQQPQQQHQQMRPPPHGAPSPSAAAAAAAAAAATPRHTQSLPLAHFAHNCPKLKSIRLHSYSPKTDDSVYEMAKYMTWRCLESITLTNCTTIQSSTLCKLAMTNPQLKSVEIMGTTPISDSSLATLANGCGGTLEYLSIGNACQLTDKSIRYIAAKCVRLRQICIFNNDREKISQDTLTAIIQQCRQLRMMSISDSRCLGTEFFAAVVQRVNNEMETLRSQRKGQEIIKEEFGLQTLCLGAVSRQVIHSPCMAALIDVSASKHDPPQQEEGGKGGEDDDDAIDILDISDQLTHLINTTKFMPKSTVIRGNTIWWQRRRISF